MFYLAINCKILYNLLRNNKEEGFVVEKMKLNAPVSMGNIPSVSPKIRLISPAEGLLRIVAVVATTILLVAVSAIFMYIQGKIDLNRLKADEQKLDDLMQSDKSKDEKKQEYARLEESIYNNPLMDGNRMHFHCVDFSQEKRIELREKMHRVTDKIYRDNNELSANPGLSDCD